MFREPRDSEKSFPTSKSDLQAQPACQRKRDSIGTRLMLDGLGITRYTLCNGLNADEIGRWSPASRSGSPRAA